MSQTSETDDDPLPIPKTIPDWMFSEIRAKTCPYRDFVISVKVTVRNFFVILTIGEAIIGLITLAMLLKG